MRRFDWDERPSLECPDVAIQRRGSRKLYNICYSSCLVAHFMMKCTCQSYFKVSILSYMSSACAQLRFSGPVGMAIMCTINDMRIDVQYNS